MEAEDRSDCRSRFVPLIYFTFVPENILNSRELNNGRYGARTWSLVKYSLEKAISYWLKRSIRGKFWFITWIFLWKIVRKLITKALVTFWKTSSWRKLRFLFLLYGFGKIGIKHAFLKSTNISYILDFFYIFFNEMSPL